MWTIYIIFLLGRANKFTDAKYTSFISDVFNLLFLIRTDCLENFVLIFLLYFILCSRSLNVSSRHSFKFQKVQKNLQLSNGKCTIEYKNHEYTFTRRFVNIWSYFHFKCIFCHTHFFTIVRKFIALNAELGYSTANITKRDIEFIHLYYETNHIISDILQLHIPLKFYSSGGTKNPAICTKWKRFIKASEWFLI